MAAFIKAEAQRWSEVIKKEQYRRGLRHHEAQPDPRECQGVAAIFAALVATSAAAQGAFPTRTVKFIVPFPGGGINDVCDERTPSDKDISAS